MLKILAASLFCLFSIGWANGQSIKRYVLDSSDVYSGVYLVAEPQNLQQIQGVLVLLGGFGQIPEHTPPETKLHLEAAKNGLLTVFCGAGNKLYADSITISKLTRLFKDVMQRYRVKPDRFVLGGFSAGGMVAMRYTELCLESPDKFPIQPIGLFLVDSPIDIFTIYEQLEETARNQYSEIAVEEAVRAMKFIQQDYGIPREQTGIYAKLTAFSMNKAYGQNELVLRNLPVRAYHDVDIAWRLKNRNQTVHNSNYEVTAELINRLMLMGNSRAEFIQSFQTGYRANGQRHPHSWSIVDHEACMSWIHSLWSTKANNH